jgi:hypothetical protein
MAMHAPITGAFQRAPKLSAMLTQIGAAAPTSGATLNLTQSDRAWLGELIETLIGVLDHADGDTDREPDDLDRCLAGEDGPARAPALDLLWSNAA